MTTALNEAVIRSAAKSIQTKIATYEEELHRDDLEESRVGELNALLGLQVEGVVAAVRALSQEKQGVVEALLLPIVDLIGGDPFGEQIELAVDRMARARRSDFNTSLAAWLSHRPTTAFTRLAVKIDPARLRDGASAELAEVSARLWLEFAEEESEEAIDGFTQLAGLKHGGAVFPWARLANQVRQSFAGAVVEQSGADVQRNRISLLKRLVKEGLVPEDEAAGIVLESGERSLAESPAAEQGQVIADFLVECFEWGAPLASGARLQASSEALASSPWLDSQEPAKSILGLLVDGALAQGQKTPKTPIEVDRLRELGEAHGSRFAPGMIAWLQLFSPSPSAVAKALAPYTSSPLPQSLASAVGAYLAGRDSNANYRIVSELIEWPPRHRRASIRVLRQLGIEGADPERVAKQILVRYERVSNDKDRTDIFKIWRALDPQDANVRRTLVRDVFIPLSKEGVGGYELCRKNLDLCAKPPHGTKGELIKALEDSPRKRPAAQEKMRRKMEQIKLKTPTRR